MEVITMKLEKAKTPYQGEWIAFRSSKRVIIQKGK